MPKSSDKQFTKDKPAAPNTDKLRTWLLNRAAQNKGFGDTPEVGQPISLGNYKNYNVPEPASSYAPQDWQGYPGAPSIEDLSSGNFLGDWKYRTDAGEYNPIGPQGQELPPGAEAWTPFGEPYFGEGVKGWARKWMWKFSEPIKDTGAPIVAEKEIPGFVDVGHWRLSTSEMSDEAKDIFNASETSKVVDVGKTFENIQSGEAGSPLANVSRATGAGVEGGLRFLGSFAKGTKQTFGAIREVVSPDAMVFEEKLNGTYFVNDYVKTDDWKTRLERGWNSGRILYTGFIDPAAKAEYEKRLLGGEDPVLLAMELENPIAEMIGELIFDPLNVLGMFAKKVGDMRRLAQVTDKFATVAPELRAVIEAADTATDVRSGTTIQNIVDAQIAVSKRVTRELAESAGDYRITSLTAAGKRYTLGLDVGEVTAAIAASNPDNPGATLEMLNALSELASGDPDRVATALATIDEFQGYRPMLLSETGQKTGVILNRMLDDSTKFLDDLAEAANEGVESVILMAEKRMAGAIGEMFPTVTEIVEAGGKVPWGIKAINRFNNYAQKLYRPINSFFAGVYMGLSPGYAARNGITNWLHIFIDQGPGALTRFTTRPGEWGRVVGEWLGGAIPKGMTGFGGPSASADLIDAVKKAGFLGVGERLEFYDAQRVIGYSVEQTMRRMLVPGRAIPDIKPLYDLGLTRSQGEHLAALIVRNRGDIRAAVKAFKAEAKTGSIEIWRTIENVVTDEKDRRAIAAFNPLTGLGEDVNKALQAPTLEEAVNILAESKMRVIEAAKDAVKSDLSVVSDDVADIVAPLGEARAAGDVPDELVRTMQDKLQANSNVMNDWQRVLYDMLHKYKNIRTPELDNIAMGRGADAVRKEANALRDLVVRWRDKSFKSATFDLEKAWANAKIPVPMPAGATVKDFRRALWEDLYFPTVNAVWDKHRDELVEITEQVARLVKEDDSASILNAREVYSEALTWDDVAREDLIRLKVGDAIKRGDNAGAARIYANQFGIPSQAESGAGLDDWILSAINKYVPEGQPKYTKLADVPPEVSRQSMVRRLREQSAGRYTGPAGRSDVPTGKLKVKIKARQGERNYGAMGPRANLELEPYGKHVSQAMETEARTMLDEIHGTGVERVHLFDMPEDTWVRESSNLGWYKTIYDEGYQDKDAVIGALERIIAGTEEGALGADKMTGNQKTIERVKKMVLDRLTGDYPTNRPPDIGTLLYFEDFDGAALAFGDYLNAGMTNFDPLTLGIDQATADKLFERWGQLIDEEAGIVRPAQAAGEAAAVADVPEEVQKYLSNPEALNRLRENIDTKGQYELIGDILKELGVDNVPAGWEYQEGRRVLGLVDRPPIETPRPAPPIETPRPAPPYAGNTPTMQRVIQQQAAGIEQLYARIEQGMRSKWGQLEDVVVSREMNNALGAWEKEGIGKIATARVVAAKVADEARKFTLLSYPEKTYLDLALSYIYPYHFWYSRTYANWIRRVATDPQVLAGYAKYREALGEIHAGAPEWWRYNINTNELLGLESENPLFFNLEATLNPLNGITGVDFTDKAKRVNVWTNTLDDLGKFGPSTWTPFSLVTALALYKQGEQEAASRWGGRLIPQTATLKSITALMNIGGPGGLELDPNVNFFSGGMDPYERNRVGRALAILVERGQVDEAAAIEAARTQSGDAWNMARDMAADQRAGGQLASFFLGVGFKARNVTDIQIDRFYNDFYKTMAMYDSLSPDEVKLKFDQLRIQYPFMDTLLLSRKSGPERDRAYSYNVLSRIPPGLKNDYSKAVGIDPRLIDRFYEDKGVLSGWPETDRSKFLAGVVDLGALLNIPENATRAEWTAAQNEYSRLSAQMERLFGEDISTKIDGFFMLGDDKDAKNAYLQSHPEVSQALDWKSGQTLSNPLLSAYYGGISTIEGFYKGNMYTAIEQQLGADISQKWDEYFAIKDAGGDYRKYWKQHPELEKYISLKDRYNEIISKQITDAVKALKPGLPASLRTDEPVSIGEQDLYGAITNQAPTPYDFTWDDWQQQLTPQLRNLVVDYVMRGDSLPRSAENMLDDLADELGLPSSDVVLDLIDDSLSTSIAR